MENSVVVNKLVVIGVGLIGGSFSLDLKRAQLVRQVVGVGRSTANLERALQLKVIDAAATDTTKAVCDADMVFLAIPVGQMDTVLACIAPALPAHTLITDGGSTKGDVAQLYRKHLPDSLHRCQPAHPIAGSDLSGAAAARYGLYENKKVVLTPLAETTPETTAKVAALWQACGAEIIQMSPTEHDTIFAAVSHLPHVLAFTYMNTILARPDAATCLQLAGSGFRDFTRIAGSHPEMWRDIVLANRAPLLADLAAFKTQLEQMMLQLEAADANALEQAFLAASKVRSSWLR
ncbi:prephenate dehydrogenase [Chitinimonas sp. BJB300]|uniref:prephenate dehydrogenase n=1 Tax=Chitinimonas sp. BJB300 TaxID=1559339 RepID=UPI000C0F22DC|nr:prephenate dehydrogenase/arogenate dehydrogenase family protein [Chitinimonas sp. BJB300]PHV09866.1 prephenate dehydrogenase [Chitinimonas sp. BJB300]TSJ87567.1 prephenate dehydrogenase/arogenate dehydrogenase family protein [Chitinimonas sp. BJB300]